MTKSGEKRWKSFYLSNFILFSKLDSRSLSEYNGNKFGKILKKRMDFRFFKKPQRSLSRRDAKGELDESIFLYDEAGRLGF